MKKNEMSMKDVFEQISACGPISAKLAIWASGTAALYDMLQLMTIEEKDGNIVATLTLPTASCKGKALVKMREGVISVGLDKKLEDIMFPLIEMAHTELDISALDPGISGAISARISEAVASRLEINRKLVN